MIEAVFDTNILLQASISSRGPAYACWELVEQGAILVYTTEAILSELEGALKRPKTRRKYPFLVDHAVEIIVNTIRTHALIVDPARNHFRLSRDIDDEKFLDLAIELGCDYLVSRDNDLLDLMDDSEFCSKFPELNIVNPVAFLEIVRNT